MEQEFVKQWNMRKMPVHLIRRVKIEAGYQEVSAAEIVRRAIAAYLAEQERKRAQSGHEYPDHQEAACGTSGKGG